MKKKENYPLIIFSLATFAFFVLFTHLIIKTDDGHFLGILNEESFSLTEWLYQRYNTVSGRTVSEFLMMSFLKINPIFWKAFATGSFVFIAWFLQKICSAFSGTLTPIQKNIFCCSVPFLVFIGALNSGAFWFAGSFTFLFPFTAFLLTVAPLTFEYFGIKYNKIAFNIIAVSASLLACSQEQTAALTIVFLTVLLIVNSFKKTLRFYHAPPMFFGFASAVWLFTSPGMTGRQTLESGSFPRFTEMNVFEKLLCGFSNYFGYSLFMSLIVTGVFAVLVFFMVSTLYDDKKVKTFSKLFLIFFVAVVVVLNIIYIAINHTVPDKGFEKAFKNGSFDLTDIFTLVLCFTLLLMLAAMLVLLIVKDKKLGLAVSILFAASVASAVVVGFSSSIYASGQRVFYFTDMLMLFACAILISSGKGKHTVNVYNTAVIIALVMFIINCFNFALLEIPIMG
ncbi:MAG: hypothetical protein IKJ69_06720 [Clostridia bacterium]|nr:hypothetical protein [Clostridia bacterium]